MAMTWDGDVPRGCHWVSSALRVCMWLNFAGAAVLVFLVLDSVIHVAPGLGGAAGCLVGAGSSYVLALLVDCAVYAARVAKLLDDDLGQLRAGASSAVKSAKAVDALGGRIDGLAELLTKNNASDDEEPET